MMLSKISRGVSRVAKNVTNASESKSSSIVFINGFLVSKRNFSIDEIGKRYEKPYDYKNKRYGLLGQIFDSTLRKLGENSLIITVEGNFGAGKSAFAQKLAKEIDFVYAREPDLDFHLFQKENGANLREVINEIAGENKKYHIDSLQEWHLSPSFRSTIATQHSFYNIRWMQTRTALLHLLSTGQGVVLERSVFSDSVIGQALYDNNLLSDDAYKFYLRDLIPQTINEIWKPHVSIYLDKSPEECLKTIKAKGKPYEKESRVYTLDLLKSVENNYKKSFLPEMRNHLHVLNYTSEEANTEKVIEDLELLDYEDQTKFSDWRIRRETQINLYRKLLSNYEYCTGLLKAPSSYVDVPEYLWYGEDYKKLSELVEADPRLEDEGARASFFSSLKDKKEKREWL